MEEVTQQYSYTKEDLEKRLKCVEENGNHIQKCLEYAIQKLTIYHNSGAKGLIVDDAMYDVYTKLNHALDAYISYNNRVTKKINGKLDDMKSTNVQSRATVKVPRRSI